jgi:hypothetical protein
MKEYRPIAADPPINLANAIKSGNETIKSLNKQLTPLQEQMQTTRSVEIGVSLNPYKRYKAYLAAEDVFNQARKSGTLKISDAELKTALKNRKFVENTPEFEAAFTGAKNWGDYLLSLYGKEIISIPTGRAGARITTIPKIHRGSPKSKVPVAGIILKTGALGGDLKGMHQRRNYVAPAKAKANDTQQKTDDEKEGSGADKTAAAEAQISAAVAQAKNTVYVNIPTQSSFTDGDKVTISYQLSQLPTGVSAIPYAKIMFKPSNKEQTFPLSGYQTVYGNKVTISYPGYIKYYGGADCTSCDFNLVLKIQNEEYPIKNFTIKTK